MSVQCPSWFPQALWDQQTEATQTGIVKVGEHHDLVKEMLSKYEAERDAAPDDDEDGEADHVEEIKALIATGDIKLDERRKTFERVAKRMTTLTDEQLIVAIANTDDDDDDLFVKCVIAVEEGKAAPTSEANMVSVEAGHAITAKAVDASKALSDAVLEDMRQSAIDRQKAAALSSRIAYGWLFVGEGKRNDNMIGLVMSWPIPGSSKKTHPELKDDNVDRYSYKRGDVNINTSFYGEEFDATPNGKALNEEIEQIKSALPGENRSPKAPKEWVAKCDAASDGKALLEKAIKARGSRRTYQVGALREAAGCVRVFEAIKTKLPHLRAAIATEGYEEGGKTLLRVDTNLAAPFRVYGFKKDGDVQVAVGTTYYTAKQFARLNVDKAVAAGGTLTALTSTVAKKAKGTGKNQSKANKVAAISVGDIKTFESMAAEVLSFMDDNVNYVMLINAVGQGPDKVDAHFIATLSNLSTKFDALTSKISKPSYTAAMKIIEDEKKKAA